MLWMLFRFIYVAARAIVGEPVDLVTGLAVLGVDLSLLLIVVFVVAIHY
jgi:hypothetical protein